ncbi:MAG TPA: hypothetical protein VI979_00760 [archaeon]|nr:hypothetical protein [archaeon]
MLTIEDIKKDLEKFDEHTREERAVRTYHLESFTLFGNKHNIPSMDILEEATNSYINGNYRSCIFACASVLERILTHEIIINSEDKEKTYWEITIGKFMLGKIIDKVEGRKTPKFLLLIKDARFIQNIRNTIAVHPLYIQYQLPTDTKDEIIWKNKMMSRDVKEALPFLDENFRNQLLNTNLWIRDGETPGGKLKDILDDCINSDIRIYRDFLQGLILERLALKSYKAIKKIIEVLYGS